MKIRLFLLLLLPSLSIAQVFDTPNSSQTTKPNFLSLQKNFDAFRNSHDLSKTKGWKWFKRWESHYDQRLNPDGSMPDINLLFKASTEEINKRKSNASVAGNWIPYGPNELPPSPSAFTSHGMGRINCVTFHPTDSNIIYVGVAQGGVWKSTDGGKHWIPLTDQLPIIRISDIAIDPQNPNTIYISVGDYAYLGIALSTDGRKRNTHYGIGVYKTTDGGTTWNPTGLSLALTQFDASLIRRVIVNPVNSQELVAVGIDGIFKSYNAGQTWTKKSSEIIWDLEQNPKNPNTLFASTGFIATLNEGNAGVLRSMNFGETWTTLNTIFPSQIAQRAELAVSPVDTNYIYAITCGLDRGLEGFYLSINNGTTWTKKYDGQTGTNILGWGNDIGGGGQGTYDLAIIADDKIKEKVYIGGINMWGSTDAGASWNGMSYWLPVYGDYLHADQHQLKFNKLNNTYFMCNDGGIYATKKLLIGSWVDAQTIPNYEWPTQWNYLGNGMQISSFYRLSLRENFGDVISGAQDNSTFYKSNGHWINFIGGDGMDCALHPTDTLTLYGSSQYGNFVQSHDGGLSFNYIDPSNGELGEWTTPIQLSENDPTKIYFGYENMQLTTNEALSFNPISDFPKMINGVGAVISTFKVAASNENYIYVAKRINHQQNEPMRFYVTDDGGVNWDDRSAGLPDSLYCTSITVDDNVPSTAWACFSGFKNGLKVYKTTNAGLTWQNISFNLPNIPVNCILHQKGSAKNTIYLGTDIGVYFTYDSLNQWESFSNLLPNVIVSDLEIHADSNKLFASTFGRGIWMSDLADVQTGINSNPLKSVEFKLFPTKNNGAFKVELNQINASQVRGSIVNILGVEVMREQLTVNNHTINNQYQLNLSPGLYFFRIQTGKYSRVVKFIVE